MMEIEKKLWRKVDSFSWIIQIVPFLRMAAVCNNLAFGKVSKDSDIDLFVIARSGRLFTVRFFLTVLMHVFGVRRHGDKIAGRFCLSFYVDESAMDLSSIALEDDIYLAYWVKALVPVVDRGAIMREFQDKNIWVEKYFEVLPSMRGRVKKECSFVKILRFFFEFMLNGRVGNFVERKLMKWQLENIHKKMKKLGSDASIVATSSMLKFHNRDRRRYYKNLWEARYGKGVKLTSDRLRNL